jgi:G3E family GTPase
VSTTTSHNEIALPPVVAVRPLLMLTGFLGTGKTTLLRSILDELTEREHLADVLLNDRENASIDRETLEDRAANVLALTGSCVCCEGYDELVEMILKASKSQHDLLLIELNGTADPIPLLESFTLLESKFCLRPRWQVCVIDARHFGKRGNFDELEKLQLETASHFTISWSSELNEQEERALEKKVMTINSQATRTTAPLLADALSRAIRNNRHHTFAKKQLDQNHHSSLRFAPIPPSKKNLHDRHELAHQFTGCNIIFPKPVEETRVPVWLKKLPASVIRAKALVAHPSEEGSRFLYERVGEIVSPSPIPVRVSEKVPCSGIFIGADLDPHEILSITREHLHPDCHFPEP